MTQVGQWRPCSACKNPIDLGSLYWVCNVSTCNRKRTGLVFCSVTCWEIHLSSTNHRQSWAVEKTAPKVREPDVPASSSSAPARQPRRTLVREPAPVEATREIAVLIIASRLKVYVRSQSGFNVSDGILAPLSDIVRRVCDEAIQNARREGRQTVLERDIPRG